MNDTDHRPQQASLVEKNSSQTDDSCAGHHRAFSGKNVAAASTPTQPATADPTLRRAKTASLTGDIIKARDSRRSPNDVLDVGDVENRQILGQSSIDLVDHDQTASPLVDKISAEELSIGAIAMLWSKEIEYAVSEIETELLMAFQTKLKDCSMESSRDATISRDELLRFCNDARIDLPIFWTVVAK